MMMLMLVGSVTALADNKDVMDQAGVLSPETQQEIKNLNQHQLGNVKTKPQLAVVTVKSLKGQDINDVAQSYFNKYHFGRKGYDNGVLLLIAVKDHQVRMQTGYGAEGALPDLYIKKLMTPGVKDQLRNQDYDGAVVAMSQQIVGRLEKQEGKIRTQTKDQAEAETKAKYDKKVQQELIGFIDFIGYALVFVFGLTIAAFVYVGCKLGKREDRREKACLEEMAKEDSDSTPTRTEARQHTSRNHVYRDDDYDRDRYDRDRYDHDDDDGMGDFVRGAVTGAIVDHMLHEHHDEEEHHHYDDDDDDDYLSHDSNDDWISSNDDSGWDSSDDDWGSSDDSGWDSGSDWGSDDDFGGFGGDSGGGGGDDSW